MRPAIDFAARRTIVVETLELLDRARALLAHTMPGADRALVVRRVLRDWVQAAERRKYGLTDKPRALRKRPANERTIPHAIKRVVHARDGGQCAFVCDNGQRCESREFLEHDHITPLARGGLTTANNLRLLWHTHNQLEADRTYGAGFMKARREGRIHERATCSYEAPAREANARARPRRCLRANDATPLRTPRPRSTLRPDMPRKSPRSRRKGGAQSSMPSSPRVRSAPGQSRTRASRAAHLLKGARPAAPGAMKKKPAPLKKAAKPRRPVATKPKSTRFLAPDPVRVAAVLEQLHELYPDARCALNHVSPLQLLVATILSAQCTDERVNMVTPALFAKYPDAAAFAGAVPKDLETAIHSTGFFRQKAKSIREACADIVAKHGGQVPRTLEELVALRGVGRKTANVVLGNAYGIASGIVVDTHVARLANRLGLTNESDPVKIEFALQPLVSNDRWTLFSHWLILHGRAVCNARKPRCSDCPVAPHCPRIGVTLSQ